MEFSVLGNHNSIAFYDSPRLPGPRAVLSSLRAARELVKAHPEWRHHPAREMMRTLPPPDRGADARG